MADLRSRSPENPAKNKAETTIEKVISGGVGLARVDGEVVLVGRVAAGETVAIAIDRSRKPARGRLLKVLEPSPHRVEPRCAVVDRCGGCDLMHVDRDEQRRMREAIVREALPPPLKDVAIVHHAATPDRGRTRARWHTKSVGREIVLGYRAAQSATIVDVDRCPVLDVRLEAAFDHARAMLAGAKGEGEVHVALGAGGLVALAVEWKGELPPSTFREAEIRWKNGQIAGVEIALEDARVPATIGDPRAVATALDGLPLVAPARGFAQASEIGDRSLVALVVERAHATGMNVVELFAGSGNFTVALAREAAHVTAIEISEPATRAMRDNLERRGLRSKVKIVVADADATPIAAGTDVVVLDPPRAGASGAVKAIAARKPKRIVYVSCEPSTLGRDLAALLSHRYRVASIDLVDLFPETSHVETVVVLQKAGK